MYAVSGSPQQTMYACVIALQARPKKLKDPHAAKAWWHQPAVDPESPMHIPFPPATRAERQQQQQEQMEALEEYHRQRQQQLQAQEGAAVMMAALTALVSSMHGLA
jgi:hypothetical protein